MLTHFNLESKALSSDGVFLLYETNSDGVMKFIAFYIWNKVCREIIFKTKIFYVIFYNIFFKKLLHEFS
ncbi:hypothetical protein HMPREF0813_00616 [Streptococcus anginosus F0211]|uniref:Uncharacterized protein n=1 Tax=Streptococcus anginosus F0211 TaxID=706437 RepID=E6J046_STRAP|nr:hypothetical protein HMPREF0813_00616 [Streptococcus anginosus F0211]